MSNELNELIHNSDIPELLKNYLLRNKQTKFIISSDLLKEIEDIYIEYDSLYIFDEAEFCSYIITSIKKNDKHDYFYHYLKKIFEVHLEVISRKELTKDEELAVKRDILANIDESNIHNHLLSILKTIEKYKETKDQQSLYLAFRLLGKLDILFLVFPSSTFINSYHEIDKKLSYIE